MNEVTEKIGSKSKRNRNCKCPTCDEWFFSRKARHRHQMVTHRGHARPVAKIRPTAELYGDSS